MMRDFSQPICFKAPLSRTGIQWPVLCGIAVIALSPIMTMRDAHAATPQVSAATPELEAITVTTEKHVERLQDVPLSIDSKTGAQLEQAGITTVRDLNFVTPGLVFDTNGAGFDQPAIRGISTGVAGQGEEANVATYIDGFYKPEELANTYDLPDIDRVEVDKGPQGTLFGRNATGGAIQIFTLQPSFMPGGHVTVSYGNFSDGLAKGFLTGPLIEDKLAGSISAFSETRDGYNHDLLHNGDAVGKLNSKLVRGKLLWRPAGWASFTLTAQYLDRFDGSTNAGQALNGNTTNTLPPFSVPRSQLALKPYDVSLAYAGYVHVTSSSFNLKSELELSAGTLTSLTQYENDNPKLELDGSYGPAPIGRVTIHEPSVFVTQELDFASRKFANWLSFVAGVSYYADTSKFDPLISYAAPGTGPNVQIDSPVDTKSIAGYSELRAEVTDRITLIAGVRDTWDKKVFHLGASFLGSYVIAGSKSWNAVTPRFSGIYKLNDNSNVYFTYSEGFKSGGINTFDYTTPYTWNPEKVKAYEVGVKSLLANRLRVNAAGFYYKYSDQQFNGLITLCRSGLCFPIGIRENAASSTIYGLDLDASAQVTDEFSLGAGVEWLHARFDKFRNAIIDRPRPLASCPNQVPCGNMDVAADVTGNPLPRAPDWTASVQGNYVKHLDPGTLNLNLTLYHSAVFYEDLDKRVHQPAYMMLNSRVSWEPAGSNVVLGIWGKNLTNEVVFQSVYINSEADGVSYQPPRQFGVSIDYKF